MQTCLERAEKTSLQTQATQVRVSMAPESHKITGAKNNSCRSAKETLLTSVSKLGFLHLPYYPLSFCQIFLPLISAPTGFHV